MKEFLDKFISRTPTITSAFEFFKLTHLLLIFSCMFFFIFFAMLWARKGLTFQKVSVFLATLFTTIVEGGRIVWRYFFLQETNGDMSFWNIVSFDLYTVCLWISIVMLFICVFQNPKKKFCQICYSFIFSVTTITAFFGIMYPENMYQNFEIWHFSNIQFLISHTMIMLICIFFAISDWLENDRFEDLWYALLSLIILGAVGVGIYFASGQTLNIMYMKSCTILVDLGLKLPWPWHIPIMGAFFFVAQIFFYLPFNWHRKRKEKKHK